MTDPREMTTGEADAWRAGWEAAREAFVAWLLADAEDWRGFTEEVNALERATAAIRAMEPPR